jgi:hypothetical protein
VKTCRVLFCMILLPCAAGAQTAAESRRSAEPPRLSEVERGFYVRAEAGAFVLSNPPTTSGRPSPFSAGEMVQAEFGYDFNEYLAAGLFVTFTANPAGSQYVGLSNGLASGDFASLVPGAALRASLIGFADDSGVRRTWIYLRAAAGYAKFYPTVLLPRNDILLLAGPGIEYFTHVRHFSIGFEVAGSYLARAKTYGFAITPTLRYAF